MEFVNFNLKFEHDGSLWIGMSVPNKTVNVMNQDVLLELDQITQDIKNRSDIKKVIVYSLKPKGFIAGADVKSFKKWVQEGQSDVIIKRGGEILRNFAQLQIPTIALVNGFCLGGGFEFALACQWIIGIDEASTRFGLPEVKLGIQPGWGGTVRLMRKIGPIKAFEAILTGKTFSAKQAKDAHIIDFAIPQRLVQGTIDSINKMKVQSHPWINYFWDLKIVRSIISSVVRKQTEKKVQREHYPAPFQMIDNFEQIGFISDKAFDKEVESIIKLMNSSTANALVNVFLLQEDLKKHENNNEEKIKHLHVVGAGVMGADIAAYAALKGLTVSLSDLDHQKLSQAQKRLHDLAKKQLKKTYLVDHCLDRLILDPIGYGIAKADLIIEAVSEDLELKKKILKHIDENAKSSAIIATNTSTYPLELFEGSFQNPSRFVGIHFFNPVPVMPLIEIVVGQNTGKNAISLAKNFSNQIDKISIAVRSSKGFVVNRILLPYLQEAMILFDEGKSKELIDKAAKSFGMPMGPIELADTVGLDVCLAALKSLKDDKFEPPKVLVEKIEKGFLGKKTKQGFYNYKPKSLYQSLCSCWKDDKKFSDQQFRDAQQRLIYALINEAAAVLREELTDSMQEIDAASIFGFGFPPFTGGIMTYISSSNPAEIKSRLSLLHSLYGERFNPDTGLDLFS